MEKNRTEDIIKNYEKAEKNYTKTAKNEEYLSKLSDIDNNQIEQNRIKMHIERLESEEETIKDFQVKEEYQRQIKESKKELENKVAEMEKLDNEKQEMIATKRKNERQTIEKITSELNDLQDKTRKDLMAEKKELENQIAKKRLESEGKNFELSQFAYKYDENGVPLNGQEFRQLQEDRAKLNEEIMKLQSSVNRCDEYRNKLIDPIKTLPDLPDDRVYIGIEKYKETEKEQKEDVQETKQTDFELKKNKNVFETNDIINNAKKDLENESKDYSKIHLEPNQIIQDNPIKDATRKNDKNVFETNNIINNVRKEMGLETENDDKKDEEKELTNKIKYIEINEADGNIFYKDENGNENKISIKEVFKYKKAQFKRLDIKNMCKEIAGGKIKGAWLGRKVNPEIVSVLQHDSKQLKDYIISIYQNKELPFELTHNLEGLGILNKIKMNKFARNEEKLGARVIGKLFDRNKAIAQEKGKKLIEGVKDKTREGASVVKDNAIKAKDKAKSFVPKINNKDAHIEAKANEAVKETQENMAKEVSEMTADKGNEK